MGFVETGAEMVIWSAAFIAVATLSGPFMSAIQDMVAGQSTSFQGVA